MRETTVSREQGEPKFKKGDVVYFADTGVGPFTIKEEPSLVKQYGQSFWLYTCTALPDEDIKFESTLPLEEFRLAQESELSQPLREKVENERAAMNIFNDIVRRQKIEKGRKLPYDMLEAALLRGLGFDKYDSLSAERRKAIYDKALEILRQRGYAS